MIWKISMISKIKLGHNIGNVWLSDPPSKYIDSEIMRNTFAIYRLPLRKIYLDDIED